MTIRRNTSNEAKAPSVSEEVGIELVTELIAKAQALVNAHGRVEPVDVDGWDNLARQYLVRVFGSESSNINAVVYAGAGSYPMGASDEEFDQACREMFRAKVKILLTCIEQLQLDIRLRSKGVVQTIQAAAAPAGNKVFVVHGHDVAAKEGVARFLEKIGLEPVILHEQPNSGRTIIEKFSDYADVAFAVVLLTGDDEGKAKNSAAASVPRARQNVIFEMGYFIGRLTRARVCVLFEQGVEILSDYQGVLYTPLDEGGRWKFDLIKELRAAGFDVDANHAL